MWVLEDLLNAIRNYSFDEKSLILYAYKTASEVHKGVKRKSGEEYITHPIAVACILAKMHADADTIAAGLLHDTIEDGKNITKEFLAERFNPTVALLVDGVTKMKKIDFDNDQEKTEAANTRKIIESITHDIRIFVIKLADRLHNMRTLEYHRPEKQKAISRETMELFVPFANLIGEYVIQLELEDLAFKYINPEAYARTAETRSNAVKVYRRIVDKMLPDIITLLNNYGLVYELRVKLKNVYGIYNRLKACKKMRKIHDVATIIILADDIDKCYEMQRLLAMKYDLIPEQNKDYIKQPKTNMYQSLHMATLIDGRYIQIQVTTHEMYRVNQYGLAAYWKLLNDNPAARMQDDVRKFQFYSLLTELATLDLSNDSYNQEVKDTLLSSLIYVYTPCGDVIELPAGSTPVDFAYKIHTEIGDNLVSANVNGKKVALDTKLQSDDVVEVFHDENIIGPRRDYTNFCQNQSTKRKIHELHKRLGIN